ncbi:MAG: DUF4445 domain-containing protein [Chloroflexi bacterium]|nr:DUF4445 domain-containing protein [Chloroflexota bacterium]
MKTCRVSFQPGGAVVSVSEGTLLLDAAARAGILLDMPCGGQGRCGRCRVKVESGEVTGRENIHLSQEDMAQGWVLSCTARVVGDLAITVPPKVERDRAIVELPSARAAAQIALHWPRYPALRRAYLELTPPSLEDNAPDLERLRRGLRQEANLEGLELDVYQMRELGATLRQDNWRVSATLDASGPGNRLVDLRPGRIKGPLLGLAVDIGTTNVVAYLVNLDNGRLLGKASRMNRQVSCGEDVISRIVFSQREGGVDTLQNLAVDTINVLVKELAQAHGASPEDIGDMVMAGNTTMAHLFLGIPPRYIREEPYVPTATHFPVCTARDLGLAIHPRASVYCVPSVAAYVGGDITAGVLASKLYESDTLSLFLDVGTNGEIVLGNKDFMMTDACSAGPALEGAGMRCGMRAMPGAIEDVRISSLTLEPTIKVIGDVPAQGICGSGLISAVAEMLVTGVISKGGKIDLDYVLSRQPERPRARPGESGPEYVLVWAGEAGGGTDITLSEVDLENLVRVKAAIYAGIMVMAEKSGIPLDTVERVLIGGAFGQHINVEQAIQIGLLPDLPWDKFHFLGNTSAWGAYNILLSKHARSKVEELVAGMTYVELIADNSFMNEFTASLFLPHTDADRFPSVAHLLSR